MYELKCTECGIVGYSDEASSIVCQKCFGQVRAAHDFVAERYSKKDDMSRLWKRVATQWRLMAKIEKAGRKVCSDRMIEAENLQHIAYNHMNEAEDTTTQRLQLLSRAMNALEGWRILLDMPITEIMKDIEKELGDD